MQRSLISLMLAAALGGSCAAQVAVHGSIRARVEGWRWFGSSAGDDSYAFSGNLLRVSFSEQHKRWDWQIELAAPLLLGLPERAVAPAPQLQLGFGGNYFVANDRERNAAMVFPKQGFVRFKELLGGDSLRAGRFEFIDATETAPKNATLAALKRDRLAHRLLGNFAFSHVGRSYDGVHYSVNRAGLNVTGFAAVPTRGVFQVDGWGNMPVAVAYGSATGTVSFIDNDGEWRVFGLYYDDARDIVKTDNRPLALRATDFLNVRIGTFGGHYIHEGRTVIGALDGLFWGVAQTGDWGRLDHRAWAFALEGGWQPAGLPKLRPWIRAGYFHSSGDDNPLDGKHGTFFQVLPTPRVYARFPFYNLMNNRDLFVSGILRPDRRVTIRTDLRGLWISNANDLWYQGGGAFQPWTFGYIGRPVVGGTKLATLWDISADWQATPELLVGGYFAHAAGGRLVRTIYPPRSEANLAYAEVTYRF